MTAMGLSSTQTQQRIVFDDSPKEGKRITGG